MQVAKLIYHLVLKPCCVTDRLNKALDWRALLEPVLEFIYDGTNRRSINWIILIWTMASLVFSNSS